MLANFISCYECSRKGPSDAKYRQSRCHKGQAVDTWEYFYFPDPISCDHRFHRWLIKRVLFILKIEFFRFWGQKYDINYIIRTVEPNSLIECDIWSSDSERNIIFSWMIKNHWLLDQSRTSFRIKWYFVSILFLDPIRPWFLKIQNYF